MISSRLTLTVLMTTLVVVMLGTGLATAADKESREIADRWGIRLGFVGTDTKTDLAAGDVLGAVVRIEDVLGFDENDSTVGLEGFYRFGAKKEGKHSIVFRLVDSSRDSSGTVQADVPIFDETFVADFTSSYDTQSLSLAYRLSLIRMPKGEAGFVAGLSMIKYDFKISGTIDDGMGGVTGASEGADFLAPLPTIGFFLKYAVTPKLIFDISADSLELDIGDIDGRVLNSEARLTWYFIRHLGVGLGLGNQDLNVTNNEEGNLFKADYRQTTATLSLSAVF
jgi:hypothetical protein